MAAIAEVTEEQVSRLDANQLTRILRSLLNAELFLAGIGRGAANVPLTLNIADGGEDALVKWEGGPPSAGRIRVRRTLYQVKSGEFEPKECAKEIAGVNGGRVPERVAENFAHDGAYVLFMGRMCSAKMKIARIKAMRKALMDSNFPNAQSLKIDVCSGDVIASWCNEHYGVAIEVHSLLGVPISEAFQPWSSWARTPRLVERPFETDVETERRLSNIRDSLSEPRGVVRITGLSGLGKTRFSLEALRPSEDENESTLSSSVAYVDEPADGGEIYLHLLALRQRQRRGVIVVDNCRIEVHERLVSVVDHPDSLLSLLTIDFDLATGDEGTPLIRFSKASDGIISAMIRRAFPEISQENVDGMVDFCDGFPRIASQLVSVKSGLVEDLRFGPITDDVLLRRLLWGRDPQSDAKRASIDACSLFHHVGFTKPFVHHRQYVAEHICGQGAEEFYRNIKYFIGKGIVDQIGAFVRVSPLPLALKLSEEWFATSSEERHEKLFNDATMPKELADSVGQRFSLLDESQRAAEIVKRLTSPVGPFSRLSFLNTKRSSRIFRSFVDVNADACLDLLVRVLGPLDANELRQVVDGRREIVWSLERLVFSADRFVAAAELLLSLAVAENESWSNNATAIFINLFSSRLSGTEADPLSRLGVIDRAMSSDEPERRRLAISAIGNAIGARHYSRMLGAERQGHRTYDDWKPTRQEDDLLYFEACLKRIVDAATCGDKEAIHARAELANSIRTQVAAGNLDGIDRALRAVREQVTDLWPEALAEARDALKYEGKRLNEADRRRIVAWISLLGPKDVRDRLTVYVWSPRPGWAADEDDSESAITSTDHLADLARDIFTDESTWKEMLPELLHGEQARGFDFGERAAQVVASMDKLLKSILVYVSATASGAFNPSFLAGVLKHLRTSRPSEASRWLETFAEIGSVTPHLAWLTAAVGFEDADIVRITNFVSEARLEPDSLRVFSFGRTLAATSPCVVADLFATVAKVGSKAKWVALSVLSMYAIRDDRLWNECEGLFTEIVTDLEVLKSSGVASMDDYAFESVVRRMLTKGIDSHLALRFVDGAVAICGESHLDFSVYDRLRPIIFHLMEHNKGVVWPRIRKAIAESNVLGHFYWNLLFTEKGPTRDTRSAFNFLSKAELLEWGEADRIAMLSVLPRELPLFEHGTSSLTVNNLLPVLLDEYGNESVLLANLSANLHSFSFTGFADDKYSARRDFAKLFVGHPRAKVAAWARGLVTEFGGLSAGEEEREAEWNAGIIGAPVRLVDG